MRCSCEVALSEAIYNSYCDIAISEDNFLFDYETKNNGCHLTCYYIRSNDDFSNHWTGSEEYEYFLHGYHCDMGSDLVLKIAISDEEEKDSNAIITAKWPEYREILLFYGVSISSTLNIDIFEHNSLSRSVFRGSIRSEIKTLVELNSTARKYYFGNDQGWIQMKPTLLELDN
ncbi:hypothetical protein HDE_12139 [Halotydeus destructor]|nr:hypothetical protein HDE_12139 [Halotydeus destructor]